VTRTLVLGIAAVALAGLTGCGSASTLASPALHIVIPADKPPSPATWPDYPHFSQHSCSGRPVPTGNRPGEQQYAPSYASAPRAHPTTPAEIVRRFLARLGDRRYLRSITFPVSLNGRPRGDRLAAVIHPERATAAALRAPRYSFKAAIASWEATLAFGALRDDFCAAGGPSLDGAELAGSGDSAGGVADDLDALGQRFPNPSPAAFRRHVALIGKRFGFRVVSLRLLRPEQIAPLLIVKTTRDREQFARDVPAIEELLNPTSSNGDKTAETFEGFFFAAEDAKGPFLSTESVFRGEVEGGQWAASENLYPFTHG
jgi:hypothetical protein